jgi:hypothetical protein
VRVRKIAWIAWSYVCFRKDGDGVDGESWFADRVVRRVGDGSYTLFWQDRWLGDVPLCRRFARLFGLAVNKHITVADMFRHGWEVGEMLGDGRDGCGRGRRRC